MAAVFCICLSGCSKWNLRGDSFPENSLSTTARQARPPMQKSEFWSFSNKARQIEADCGAQ
jgi:hypothetical protein